MRVLITGANGFLGKNLTAHLMERPDIVVVQFSRENAIDELPFLLKDVDFVFHLAGVNRPKDSIEFKQGNADLTAMLCDIIAGMKKKIPVLYTSSIQAALDNPYGASKYAAEKSLFELSEEQGAPVFLFRLPNVFGKWSRPNYNSVVATFCYNISQGLPVHIHDSSAQVSLVYIDDVISTFISVLDGQVEVKDLMSVQPQYEITVGELADQIQAFKNSNESLISEPVGRGLVRALYSTYVSYLEPKQFSYTVPKYEDQRGIFVEMLKTKDTGQFSYFTAHSGVTRGGHYHHSKTEKFLVIKGQARFCFRQIISGDFFELYTDGENPKIVESVPGWTHDVTNVGSDDMIVMLWANEVFDRDRPDTYAMSVVDESDI